MTAARPLHSEFWYRVASLKPRLQPGTHIQRQLLRGEEWFVFSHPITGRHYRLNRKAYELVGRLDGEHSLDSLWQGLEAILGDGQPTQDEVIAMLSHLMDTGLILYDTVPDWAKLKQRRSTRRRRDRRSRLNPFAFRIKLFNPSRLLDRLMPLHAFLWHPVMAILWMALVGWGVVYAALDWNAIHAYAGINLLTPRCLLLAWFAYPVMKALHELGHALAVRHWGGQVKEAGLGVFLLVPTPYVDASASTAFAGKWQRAAVSSAGIAVELFLAALALLVWTVAENGVVRDFAFAVMAIGSLSTLAFNANPLMRFDGYYILCDVLELPNLSSRSMRWWMQRLQRIARRTAASPSQERGSERLWLFLYAPASWMYRVFISVIIVQWIAEMSVPLAFGTMTWLMLTLLVAPVWTAMRVLLAPAHPGTQAWKPLFGMAGAIVALVGVLLWVPIPSSTVASGVVWLPEHSQIRTESDARVMEIVARDGEMVTKGQPVIITSEPLLSAKKARLFAQIAAAETEQVSGWLKASLRGRNAFEDIERLQSELAQVEEQLNKLTLHAETDGIFVIPRGDDLLGRDIARGTPIAYVLANEASIVRVVIRQDDIGRFNGGLENVSVRLADANGQEFDAHLLRLDPAATNYLPSKALGDKGGGNIVTDPAEPDGMRALETVFVADVRLADRKAVRAGERAWVRFEHQARPLAETIVWRTRQLFLKVFSMEGQ